MRDRVRVCLVGLGWTGSNHLAGYAAVADRATVTAVVARSAAGQAKARSLGVPRIYDDWHAALEDPAVDAVDFCTPSFLHAEQAAAALDAGKHVLCETPACQSLEEARRLRWAIGEHPTLTAQTGHIARCWPTFVQAKRLVDEGAVGEIFYISSNYAHQPDPQEYPSHLTWARNLTYRARLGVGHHSLDLVRWYAGDVSEVQGNQTAQAGVAILHFRGGALGKVFASGAVVRPYILSLSIYGDKGTIVCWWEDEELRGQLHTSARWEPTALERTPMHGRGSPEWAAEMGNFVDSIRGLARPRCSMLEGVAMVETGISIQLAIDTGSRVRVMS